MPWWRRRDDDLDAELRAHLEMATRDQIERGDTVDEAVRRARRELGNLGLIKDATRDMWRWRRLEQLALDVRHSLRVLTRSPGFAVASVICIACGVGVTTTIFGAVNALLLRPLPYADAHELVVVHSRNLERRVASGAVAWPDMVAWRDEAKVFDDIGVYSPSQAELTGADGEPERVMAADISPGVLRVLRQSPILGRNFEESEQQFGNHRKVLLSHSLWQRRYGSDPRVVGRTIDIASRPAPVQPYLVVGVMPPGVSFPEGAELWKPADIDIDEYPKNGSRHYFGAIGRLAPGATLTDANVAVVTIARRLQTEYPQAQAGWDARVVSLRDELIGDLGPSILLFQGAAVLVLLIACANVANLSLARGATRQREMAIRIAIGAGQARIVRHLLTESIVLAIVGGVVGIVMAFWGVRLLAIAFPDGVPSYIDLAVDQTVLAFTTVISVVTGVMFGLAPALRASRILAGSTLQERNRGAAVAPKRNRLRNALVAAEVGLSLVLMIGATLLVRSDLTIRSELGFDPQGVLSVGVPTPPQKYEGPPREMFYRELAERIRRLPAVDAVGWAGVAAPLERPMLRRSPVRIEGRPDEEMEVLVHEVSPDFLKATGVKLVRGRSISSTDRPAGNVSSFVTIINESFARMYFPNADPIGKRVQAEVPGAGAMGTRTFTIIAIAQDFRQEQPPRAIGPAMYVYVPLGMNSQVLTIRTTLPDPLTLLPGIQTILRQLDPALSPATVRTLEAAIARGLWRERLHERVLGIFAGLALLLAVFGVYGVISYAVAQRTHEFGVRLALGATQAQVLRLVLRQGVWLTTIGVAAGVTAALQLTAMLSGVLHEVRPTDPATFAGVSALLAGVVLLAALAPARHASKVDPVVALRVDG